MKTQITSSLNFGDKQAQTKISKRVFSANIRTKRIAQGRDINPAFCNECGFRVRGENHLKGVHHRGILEQLHRH